MASGSEVTCITWTGDGNAKTIAGQRTVNSIEIHNVTDEISTWKLRTMGTGFALQITKAGAVDFADTRITFTEDSIAVAAAVNINAKVFHARIVC